MSKPYVWTGHCDFATGVGATELLKVTASGPGEAFRAAFRGHVSAIGSAVWDTPDGSRPTQGMVNDGLTPILYTAVTFDHVTRLAGPTLPTELTVYVDGGVSGADRWRVPCTHAPADLGQDRTVFLGAEVTTPVTLAEGSARLDPSAAIVKPIAGDIFYDRP